METSFEPGPSNWLLRSFSDDLQEETSGDALNRGLATKVAVDRHRERQPTALRDQWNLFLLEAREMAIESVVFTQVSYANKNADIVKVPLPTKRSC